MKKFLGVVAMAVVALALGACPSLAAKSQAKAEIKAFLDQTAASFARLDTGAVAATALPDATIHYLDGRSLSPAQWQEGAAKSLADIERMRVSFKLMKLKAKGDQAKIKYKETDAFVKKSEPGREYGLVSTWQGVLVKTARGWRFKELRQLSAQATKDGKPQAAPLTAK